MGFSDHWESLLLQHVFNIAKGVTTEVYVGLSSQDPLDDESGVSEPSGKGYARVKTSVPGGTSWQMASGATVTNAVEIDFPPATDLWGTMTHLAVFDSISGGNLCAYGALDQNTVVETGDLLRLGLGEVQVYEYTVSTAPVYEALAALAISKTVVALSALNADQLISAAVSSKTLSEGYLSQAFTWVDTSDFSWEDDGDFSWRDT